VAQDLMAIDKGLEANEISSTEGTKSDGSI